jgi:hypothetical protein
MRVHVEGFSSVVDRAVFKRATQLFGKLLIPPEIRSEILILIDLTDYLEELGNVGEIKLPRIGIEPKQFSISINTWDTDEKDQLTTLGHEMVHVKQIATGEFAKTRRNGELGVRWHKRFHKKAALEDDNSPWEREAYKMEQKLYVKLLKAARMGTL